MSPRTNENSTDALVWRFLIAFNRNVLKTYGIRSTENDRHDVTFMRQLLFWGEWVVLLIW